MILSPQHLFRKSILFGFGALGASLSKIIESRALTFTYVVDPSPKVKPKNNSSYIQDLSRIPSNFEPYLIIIAVQDNQILHTAETIGKHFNKLENCLIAHTSGALDFTILKTLKGKGALIGSWHPMMSFTHNQPISSLEGVITGIEGDKKAVEILTQFSEHLGAIPLPLNKSNKVFYHLLGVFASNFLVAHFAYLEELFHNLTRENSNISLSALQPIIQQTMANIFSSSPAEALSGPVQRKDFSTIEKHLEAMNEQMPHLLPYYKQMTVKLAEMINYSETEQTTLQQLMEKF